MPNLLELKTEELRERRKRQKERTRRGYFRFGFSSILLTLAVLAIASFGALSLTTALSDRRLSEKVRDNTTAYYEAENQMNRSLAQIDELLSSAYQSASDEETFTKAVEEGLDNLVFVTSADSSTDSAAGESISKLTYEDGVYTLDLQEPITDSRTLMVRLTFTYPNNSSTNYEITKYESETNITEQPDMTLHVPK